MWVKDFVIYLDAICNIFTLIPSGPVDFLDRKWEREREGGDEAGRNA